MSDLSKRSPYHTLNTERVEIYNNFIKGIYTGERRKLKRIIKFVCYCVMGHIRFNDLYRVSFMLKYLPRLCVS